MLRVELGDWETMRPWAAPIRFAVFVDEQKVPIDMEVDDWDPQCVHAVAFDAQAADAFALNAQGRWQCDLYRLARQRLTRAGVDRVSGGGHCTYAEEGSFFSHRRDVQHRGTQATGRMATLIWRT